VCKPIDRSRKNELILGELLGVNFINILRISFLYESLFKAKT